jgi:hypothetical protein
MERSVHICIFGFAISLIIFGSIYYPLNLIFQRDYYQCLNHEISISKTCNYQQYHVSFEHSIPKCTVKTINHIILVSYIDNSMDKLYPVPDEVSKYLLTTNKKSGICYYDSETDNVYYDSRCSYQRNQGVLMFSCIVSLLFHTIYSIFCFGSSPSELFCWTVLVLYYIRRIFRYMLCYKND